MKVVLSISMSTVHKLINVVQQSPRIKRNIFYYQILANQFLWNFYSELIFKILGYLLMCMLYMYI